MRFRSLPILFLALGMLSACRHPLSIVGEGDIVDLNGSSHGCSLEQFQAADVACTENEVLTDYSVNYSAVARDGWRFVGWQGNCAPRSEGDNCLFDVPAAWVAWFDGAFPGAEAPGLVAVFEEIGAGLVDLDSLPNYANQPVPDYIDQDNTENNVITDEGAMLGRVLFYDKQLSTDNSIACASCHQQALGFSDPDVVSTGVNGTTGRHSMRLVNVRFAAEEDMFWDERADSVEDQATQPIRDHAEMGFSGEDGAPEFSDLLQKMNGLAYYPLLFEAAFGTADITEQRMQFAIAQFVRSIQSFDSKYDEGLVLNGGDEDGTFPNFTAEEQAGLELFFDNTQFNNSVRVGGGLDCETCHRAPEFDISPGSDNNGVITVAGSDVLTDLTNTRSPSLRDLFGPDGSPNGPMMHDGSMATFSDVLDHYNDIELNANLDNRLRGNQGGPGGGGPGGGNNGTGQQLNLTAEERAAVEAFLKTLTGRAVYTDERWSDPFDADGELTVVGG